MSRVVRVLIADDHPVVRSGIKGMLEPDPGFAVVGEAASGREAVAMALREHPDVVLMDLQMPGLDGASATAGSRRSGPRRRCSCSPPTAATPTSCGRSTPAPSVTSSKTLRTRKSPARWGGGTRRTLACARHRPAADAARQLAARGLSNSLIASELFVSATTAKAHLVHIYAKLGVNDRTAAVTTALERGIIRLDQT